MTTLLRSDVAGELDALVAAHLAEGTGLGWLQSAGAVEVVALDGGALRGRGGQPDTAEVWFARVWTGERELRWARQADGPGGEMRWLDDPGDPAEGVPVAELLPSRRILWGAIRELDDGWARLQEARTVALWVPAPEGARKGQRLGIATQEVVVECDDALPSGVRLHGNRAVVDELYGGLEIVAQEDQGDTDA